MKISCNFTCHPHLDRRTGRQTIAFKPINKAGKYRMVVTVHLSPGQGKGDFFAALKTSTDRTLRSLARLQANWPSCIGVLYVSNLQNTGRASKC